MMSYFGLREWQYQNTNIDELSTILRNQHQNGYNNDNLKMVEKFGQNEHDTNMQRMHKKSPNLEFDMRTINWNEYFYHYLPGIKKYFFKENTTGNEKCKRRYARLQILHILLKSSFGLLFVYLSGHVVWRFLLTIILS